MEILGGERVPARDVGEADERVHQRELTRMIELAPGNALAMGQPGNQISRMTHHFMQRLGPVPTHGL